MSDENIIISKEDFLDYLKYLKTIFKDTPDSVMFKNIKECIESESVYQPSVYYYDELLNNFDELISLDYKDDIIKWSKISRWKAYLRKYKIKKIL